MSAVLQLKPIPADPNAPPAEVPVDQSPVVMVVKKATGALGDEPADITSLTKLYLKLRAGKADLTEQSKKKLAPVNMGLDLLEGYFLNKMNELNVDSLKNEAGTPYKSNKVSITVADNDAWIDFVLTQALEGLPVKPEAKEGIKNLIIGSGMLSLIEARASKTAVESYMTPVEGEPSKDLPPGLTRREETTVNLRASK